MTTLSRHKVLIIDDDETVCRVLALTLKRSGMTALTTTSPVEGLAMIRRQPPDIVISDVRMPEMSGIDLLTRLRAEGILTPFVVISAQSSRDVLLTALRIGAFDLISKPLQASIISRLMDEAIRVSQRQKLIALLKPGAEPTTHDLAVWALLANVAPVVALDQGRLDPRTLEVLAEQDPLRRTLAAALLALTSSRTSMDNLRNFQDRTWDLGVLIRVFHGMRAGFAAIQAGPLADHLATLEASFAWLRVRPEDLAADLAQALATAGEHLTQALKALRDGSGETELARFAQHLTALEARIQKIHLRSVS